MTTDMDVLFNPQEKNRLETTPFDEGGSVSQYYFTCCLIILLLQNVHKHLYSDNHSAVMECKVHLFKYCT